MIRDVGTDNNTIMGNYVGTDITGTLDRGNGVTGVTVYLGASNNSVGTAAAGNLVFPETNRMASTSPP